jgi:hypothetical protein
MQRYIMYYDLSHILLQYVRFCMSNNIVLLRDVFHIDLVIGPRPAVLAWGAAERQYNRPRFDHIKANKSKLINNSYY